ncbi:uncharacterized protein L969DRAFT_43536 [Mixia osmundae IAM 14324]|uniref:Uncharacterized protein n=1 Tax=Mixia osmundae (strain CBS 9802 / IAM 14324 / JCM 22182 / KY 12970) TaxID=764103 RepID=G7E851_MIXOS|nr:uncharacterized protein L969DRAFT_43536 [Mixia osmundae IAM 14324]KEI42398.1 hypothetical protein L969DRAFT_43536 [Mixia osmundae IAM 14324]GAA99011.1 hypothetical protein E5Q_05700 [Mixia osmundae IAM 14324]
MSSEVLRELKRIQAMQDEIFEEHVRLDRDAQKDGMLEDKGDDQLRADFHERKVRLEALMDKLGDLSAAAERFHELPATTAGLPVDELLADKVDIKTYT